MKPTSQLFAPRAAASICCPLAGFGVLRAAAEQIVSLRRNPVPEPGQPLPISLLKNVNEQTVVGLAALYRAIHDHNLHAIDFAHWGVIATPCFLGRAKLAHLLQRFAVEGAGEFRRT